MSLEEIPYFVGALKNRTYMYVYRSQATASGTLEMFPMAISAFSASGRCSRNRDSMGIWEVIKRRK